MGYFDHPYLSNSKLTQFAKELKGDDTPIPYEAYRFGSLFDAVVTEPHKLDRFLCTLTGTDYTYTQSEIERADKMFRSLMQDSFCANLVKTANKQEEKYSAVTILHNGFEFSLNMKCKYDFITTSFFADLKSTSATTQAQFENACDQFDYWRQVAIYGKLGWLKRAMLIGVSKINFKVFKIPLMYGDERWTKGQKQFEELAFKYWLQQ